VELAQREAAAGRRGEVLLLAAVVSAWSRLVEAAASRRGAAVGEVSQALEVAGLRSRAAVVAQVEVEVEGASQGLGVGRPAGVEALRLRGSPR